MATRSVASLWVSVANLYYCTCKTMQYHPVEWMKTVGNHTEMPFNISKLVLIPIRNKSDIIIFFLVKLFLEHSMCWSFRILSLMAAITGLRHACTHEQRMTKRTQPKLKFPKLIIQ